MKTSRFWFGNVEFRMDTSKDFRIPMFKPRSEVGDFVKNLNEILKDYPGATIQWLQSSTSGFLGFGRYIHLTAIINMDNVTEK